MAQQSVSSGPDGQDGRPGFHNLNILLKSFDQISRVAPDAKQELQVLLDQNKHLENEYKTLQKKIEDSGPKINKLENDLQAQVEKTVALENEKRSLETEKQDLQKNVFDLKNIIKNLEEQLKIDELDTKLLNHDLKLTRQSSKRMKQKNKELKKSKKRYQFLLMEMMKEEQDSSSEEQDESNDEEEDEENEYDYVQFQRGASMRQSRRSRRLSSRFRRSLRNTMNGQDGRPLPDPPITSAGAQAHDDVTSSLSSFSNRSFWQSPTAVTPSSDETNNRSETNSLVDSTVACVAFSV
ncbi:uncharacterized protein LOC143459101 [Clavelina lepadiformis]|uniref:uncharacterized protein LOC143459101 n=1 Tax=Clavelina lepadiformis TaxID=159417 RepID=UPI004043088F